MQVKPLNRKIIERLNVTSILILFAWISFFPQPVQGKYGIAINIFLVLNLMILIICKPTSTFKLRDYPLWIFLAAISINILFAKYRIAALKTYFDVALPFFCIYYLISTNFSSKKNFNFLVDIISFSSTIVSLFAIFESLSAFNPIYAHLVENPYYLRYAYGFVRPMSTQYNPTALGGYLLGCLPFNYLLFKRANRLFILLGAIGIILNTVVIILTCSRGAFLGMAAMVIFYLFAQRKFRLIFVFLIILFLFSLVLAYLPYPVSKLSIKGAVRDYGLSERGIKEPAIIKERAVPPGEDLSGFGTSWIFDDSILSTYRLDRCDMTMRIFKDHPWMGIGLNNFRRRFYEYYPGKNSVFPEIMIADNMYLTLLAETGVIGFLGFLIYIISFLARGIRELKLLGRNSEKKQWLLISLMAFVGLLVDMGGYEFFYWRNQFMLFCFVSGCINACLSGSKEELAASSVT